MSHSQTLSVEVFGSTPEPVSGNMTLETWSPSEANTRARKKIFKIVGTILLCSLIGTIVHLLLLIIIPTLFVTLIVSFPLYMKWSDELVTCIGVDATCPSCKKTVTLRPYLNAKFKAPMTLQCPSCGQTSKAAPTNEADVLELERMAAR